MDREFYKAQSLEQFRFQEQNNRARRLGLKYYVAYQDPDKGTAVLLEQKISDKTDAEWLKNAINLQAIFLSKIDFEITLMAIRRNG